MIATLLSFAGFYLYHCCMICVSSIILVVLSPQNSQVDFLDLPYYLYSIAFVLPLALKDVVWVVLISGCVFPSSGSEVITILLSLARYPFCMLIVQVVFHIGLLVRRAAQSLHYMFIISCISSVVMDKFMSFSVDDITDTLVGNPGNLVHAVLTMASWHVVVKAVSNIAPEEMRPLLKKFHKWIAMFMGVSILFPQKMPEHSNMMSSVRGLYEYLSWPIAAGCLLLIWKPITVVPKQMRLFATVWVLVNFLVMKHIQYITKHSVMSTLLGEDDYLVWTVAAGSLLLKWKPIPVVPEQRLPVMVCFLTSLVVSPLVMKYIFTKVVLKEPAEFPFPLPSSEYTIIATLIGLVRLMTTLFVLWALTFLLAVALGLLIELLPSAMHKYPRLWLPTIPILTVMMMKYIVDKSALIFGMETTLLGLADLISDYYVPYLVVRYLTFLALLLLPTRVKDYQLTIIIALGVVLTVQSTPVEKLVLDHFILRTIPSFITHTIMITITIIVAMVAYVGDQSPAWIKTLAEKGEVWMEASIKLYREKATQLAGQAGSTVHNSVKSFFWRLFLGDSS